MEIIAGLGSVGIIVLAIFAFFAPLFLYLTQRNTYQTRQEIRKTNKLLAKLIEQGDQLADQLDDQNKNFQFITAPPEPTPEPSSNTVTMTCEHCGKTFKYGKNHSFTTKPCPGCQQPIILK